MCMQEFEIISIEGNKYTLKNLQTGDIVCLKLKFFDLETPLQLGDKIFMHSELINADYEEYSLVYFFGAINQKYGRKITSKNDRDLMFVVTDNHTILLKRFFG